MYGFIFVGTNFISFGFTYHLEYIHIGLIPLPESKLAIKRFLNPDNHLGHTSA